MAADSSEGSRALRRARGTWERLGRENPMWAVLTGPEEWDEEEFFATGAEEIAEVMSYADSLGRPAGRARALDFGCGLGRLTRALAGHFDEAVGVDVAESMVEQAIALNEEIPNCGFVHNPRTDLSPFGSGELDFVYSSIVLQHVAPALAKGYIAEFVRVLRDDGLAVFQIPVGWAAPAEGAPAPRATGLRRLANVPAALKRLALRPFRGREMEMNFVPEAEVVATVEAAGGRVLDVTPNRSAGPQWESRRFAVVREA